MKLVQSLLQLIQMNLNNLNNIEMPTSIRTVMSLQLNSFHLLLWHLPLPLTPSFQIFLINFLKLNNLRARNQLWVLALEDSLVVEHEAAWIQLVSLPVERL